MNTDHLYHIPRWFVVLFVLSLGWAIASSFALYGVSAAPSDQGPQQGPKLVHVDPTIPPSIVAERARQLDRTTQGKLAPDYNTCDPTNTNSYAFRNCTWYAWYRHPDLPGWLSDGGSWGRNASGCGWNVGSTPYPGALASFSGSPGHVAYVESVPPNGGFIISEYNLNN